MKRIGIMPVRFILSRKEGFTISAQEQQKNEMIYLASVAVVRRLYLKGGIDVEILKRLNRKNAETMGCAPIDFINYN